MRAATLFVIALTACTLAAGSQARKPLSPPPNHKTASSLSAEEIFKRVSSSVVVVESLNAKGSVVTLGSGVVVASSRPVGSVYLDQNGNPIPQDEIVTNRHVVADGITYRIERNGKSWPAKLIRVDPDHDLAELSVNGLDAPTVQVRDSSTLAVGEKVFAIGAPEGLELTISEGLISGLRDLGQGKVIQTSAAISPGSSGGGLFDARGRLVGITTFYLKEGQSLNFALPAEWALALDHQQSSSAADLFSVYRKASPAFQAVMLLVLATKADQVRKYDIALQGYQEAVRLKPDFAEAWYGLGIEYGHLRQDEMAVSALQKAVRLKPDLEDAWVRLGANYGTLGQCGNVISAEQEAIRLKTDDERAWFLLGAAYGGLGQYDKEASAEQEAARLKPDDALAWYGLGLAYHALGQQSEVITVYEKLKTLDPKLAEKFFKEDVLP